MTQLLDLTQAQAGTGQNCDSLNRYLDQLAGEPFAFMRMSYGDELTLHFGDLRPAKSSKLKGTLYGTYLIGVRASAWVLKPGTKSAIASWPRVTDLSSLGAVRLGSEQLEAASLIPEHARIVAALAFADEADGGFGLSLRFSDGSSFVVLPDAESAETHGEELPKIGDWELLSPGGLLTAGPGLRWKFEPRGH